ncbi:DUF1552 domain-containing protein [Marinicellulosiphila megalodicopiae]|uniref:DUF1552 domain-containing protein n=1 Tax=Marinicellulosiphila megalodicopiae TaxID=2724896 RepID=UPI003BAF88DB
MMKRRAFLKQTISSASAVPISLGMLNAAKAATSGTTPTNFVFFYVPDGCTPDRWHPTGEDGNLNFPSQTAGLADIQDKLIFLKDITMYGRDGNPGGGGHEAGIKRILTANATESLDLYLGRRIQEAQTPVPYSNLFLGLYANYQSTAQSKMSYNKAGSEPTYLDDPLHAYTTYFGDMGTTPTGILQNKAVIDSISADLNALKGKVGYEEYQRLNTHTESLFEMEQRLTKPADTDGDACSQNVFNPGGFDSSNSAYYEETNADTLFSLQTDVAVQALACGVTRVVSISVSHKVSPNHFGLAFGQHHPMSHTTGSNEFDALKSYTNAKFKQLVQKLDNEGLLASTVVLLCSELGDSNSHSQQTMPFVLAGQGGQGSKMPTGRLVQADAHTNLLVSLIHMAGFTDVIKYGDDGISQNTGPMSGLIL